MGSEVSWILLCVIISCVGVTTRSLEDDFYNYYNYDESLYQRSQTPQDEQSEVRKDLNIAMPNVHPMKHDSYYCTALKVLKENTYVDGYEPHAEMNTAHHMLLFGCEYPPSKDKFWNCGDMGVGVCGKGSGEKIMYAWGRNAPKLKLPKGVAFKVGDKSTKYMVLQVHYGHVDKFKNDPKLMDSSGVTLKTTNKRTKYLAGIDLIANGYGLIPPRHQAFNLNIGCRYMNNADIHPFAFRVHAHSLGRVVTGYRVRDGKWKLIGKGDPQRPQAFYDVADKSMVIEKGDTLAGRCTYDTTKKTRTTYIGATMKDEMCNFYMMFYYDPKTTNQSPEDSCTYAQINPNDYPADSMVPLPGSGKKMEMKREAEGSPDPCPACKRSQDELTVEKNWPAGGQRTGELPNEAKFGQITGVSIATNGNVVIFHRSSRSWQGDTFDDNNVLAKEYHKAIPENTVTWLDPKTGSVVKQWGAGMFFLPHGLTVDKEDNLWLTDVGSHQVFKFNKGSNEPSITKGTKLIPGSDNKHFCKPTGVALDSEGNFFVADGYCNQRVLKYSPSGQLLFVITNEVLSQGPAPHHFFIPHSASTDKTNNLLYIADRENGRVLVFNTKTGKLLKAITGFGSRVFAAHYSPLKGGLLHVVNGDDGEKIKGFTYSVQTNTIMQEWYPPEGFEMPHDVASDNAGRVYVAEIKHPGGRIWKFV